MGKPKRLKKGEIILKEHTYDGIQEYDQRLPNWWLYTLYGAIIFSFVYWFFYFQTNTGKDDIALLKAEMAAIELIKLENSFDVSDDQIFWDMSANANYLAKGEATYNQICIACHGPNLQGVTGLGFNLVDNEWIHGAKPSQIYVTIDQGIAGTGMQAWGPQLGQKRIAEVVAFVLSKNDRTTMEAAQ